MTQFGGRIPGKLSLLAFIAVRNETRTFSNENHAISRFRSSSREHKSGKFVGTSCLRGHRYWVVFKWFHEDFKVTVAKTTDLHRKCTDSCHLRERFTPNSTDDIKVPADIISRLSFELLKCVLAKDVVSWHRKKFSFKENFNNFQFSVFDVDVSEFSASYCLLFKTFQSSMLDTVL